MATYKFQGWRFCRYLKQTDCDPTNAFFCRSHSARVNSEEFISRWGSSLVGSVVSPRVNKKSEKVIFQEKLICDSGVHIEEKEIKKFYQYLEKKGYIEIHYQTNKAVDWDEEDEHEHGSVGVGVPEAYDVSLSICLTSEGVDFADLTIVGLFNTEVTWAVSFFALFVSMYAVL
jgi:hypothetical protein